MRSHPGLTIARPPRFPTSAPEPHGRQSDASTTGRAVANRIGAASVLTVMICLSAGCATRSTAATCPPARLRVTPATSEDWIEIEAMLHDYLEWLRAVTGLEPTVEQPRFGVEIADPQRAFAADGTTMLVARMATRQVGMVAIRRSDDGSAELTRLYVRPVARGRRIADLLVAEAIGAASCLGATSVWLETLRGVMDPAMTVYRRHGLEVVDQPSGIGHAGAVVMNRPLA